MSAPKLLFKDRPEWKDVTPVYNSAVEDGVLRIATTEEFTDAFAYLRALIVIDEMSERALNLTSTCTALNAANYTVWQYRRKLLNALGKNIDKELEFCDAATSENPKNYQVWHHRRVLVEIRGNASGELAFINTMLIDDPKNYHAWQYRQWLVDHFDLYAQSEIDYATQLILEDLRNNSAWNYRYFIVSKLSDAFTDDRMLSVELTFAMYCIRMIPNNESSWSYLGGLLTRDGLTSRPEVSALCEELLAQPSKSVHLRNFLVDSIAKQLQKSDTTAEERLDALDRANKLLTELEDIDPIRLKYWRYRRNHLCNLANASATKPSGVEKE